MVLSYDNKCLWTTSLWKDKMFFASEKAIGYTDASGNLPKCITPTK